MQYWRWLKLTIASSVAISGAVAALEAAAEEGATLSVQQERRQGQRSLLINVGDPITTGKSFATHADTWLELLFSDGTSVVLAPETAATIEQYSYSRQDGSRTLTIMLKSGHLRATPSGTTGESLTIRTGEAVATLIAASAIVERTPEGATKATLLWGRRVTLSSNGETVVVSRPGFEVVAASGAAPSTPGRLSQDELRTRSAALTPGAGADLTIITGALAESAAPRPSDEVAVALADKDAGVLNSEIAAGTVQPSLIASVETAQGGLATATTSAPQSLGTSPLQISFNFGQASSLANGSGTALAPPGPNSTASSAAQISDSGAHIAAIVDNLSTFGNVRVKRSPNFIPAAQPVPTYQYLGVGNGASGNALNMKFDATLQLSFARETPATGLNGSGSVIVPTAAITGGTTDPITQVFSFNVGAVPPGGTQQWVGLSNPSPQQFNLVGPTGTQLTDIGGNPVPVTLAAPASTVVSAFDQNGPTNAVNVLRSTFAEVSLANRLSGTDSTPAFTVRPPTFNLPTPTTSATVTPGDPQPTTPLAPADHNGLVAFVGADNPGQAFPTRNNCVGVNPCFDVGDTPAAGSGTAKFFVLDKFTAGTSDEGNTQFVPGERFFAIGGQGLTTAVSGGQREALPGVGSQAFSVVKYAVSDGLVGFRDTATIETQALNGLTSGAVSGLASGNAFRPDSTFVDGKPRGDTQILLTSAAPTAAAGPAQQANTFLRADVQITADGRSSASLATGNVAPSPLLDNPLVLSGAVVGSTRPSIGAGSTQIASPLGSIGTSPDHAGDSHVFGGNLITGNRIGFFGVTQQDPTVTGGGSFDATQVGTLRAVGLGATTPYVFAHLATGVAVDSQAVADFAARSSRTLTGFATAVVESSTAAGGSLYGVNADLPSGVVIQTNSALNTLSAQFGLSTSSVGSAAAAPSPSPLAVTANFGGIDNKSSAFVTDGTYGARGTAVTFDQTAQAGANVAMVTATTDLIKGIETPAGIDPPITSEHVQWGFWFGDLLNDPGARQDHVNLGYWVAGNAVSPNSLSGLTGTATYGGHTIGTVVSAGAGGTSIRDVVGSFASSWNFGSRSGSVTSSFDGASYAGTMSQPAGSGTFSGSAAATTRTMALNGGFFNNGPVPAAGPGAMAGRFSIQENAGQLTAYRAQGVFVGKR